MLRVLITASHKTYLPFLGSENKVARVRFGQHLSVMREADKKF